MSATVTSFTCDAPDCRSSCQLCPADARHALSALAARGWYTNEDAKPPKHYCPRHVPDLSTPGTVGTGGTEKKEESCS